MEKFLGSINCWISHDIPFHRNNFNGPYGRNIIDITSANNSIQRSNCNRSSSIERTSFTMVQNNSLVSVDYHIIIFHVDF